MPLKIVTNKYCYMTIKTTAIQAPKKIFKWSQLIKLLKNY